MYNPLDLTGKYFVVTGASSGIGQSCAIVLAKLGAKLLLIARNQQKLWDTVSLLENQNEHKVVTFDLSDVGKVQDLVKIVNFKDNKVNGVVHSAGIAGAVPIGATTPKTVESVFSVNFGCYIELCRCLSKRLYSQDNSSFVAISSVASQAAWKGGTAYCASKAALEAATRVLALELADRRVRFNTVVPSYIKTKIVEEAVDSGIDAEANVKQKQPFGFGEPLDVAHAVAFLLSDAARFITGTNLVVDGGYLAQ